MMISSAAVIGTWVATVIAILNKEISDPNEATNEQVKPPFQKKGKNHRLSEWRRLWITKHHI